jgi:transposase
VLCFGMSRFVTDDRSQPFLLPPDLKDWVAEDDLAHFVIAACERVPVEAFKMKPTAAGKAQYHPRLMLALLVYCYANGIFSSRRIERATWRDLGVRFVAANQQPDHDTIAHFRRENRAAFEAAFVQVLLMASGVGLTKLGTVSVDGTKIEANASKIRTVRYDRAKTLRAKLAADVAALLAKAEATDAGEAGDPSPDGQALPDQIARRQALHDKLDAAIARLEAEHADAHAAALLEHEARAAAWDTKAKARQQRGTRPVPPDDDLPPPDATTNLTDPDSALMRKSNAHEYRQAYNAQAVVDADGTQLIVQTDVLTTPSDQKGFAPLIGSMATEAGTHGSSLGLPARVLADAGYACGKAVAQIEALGVDPYVAIGRTTGQRPYDFRPPPGEPGGPLLKEPRPIKKPWRTDMQAKLETTDGQALYQKRQQTVEPVFGIIKTILGFKRFSLRGMDNVKTEWLLVALAYNCKRMTNQLKAA